MAELFDRLEKTGALLSSAIDQYLDACVAIRNHPQLSFAGVSRAFFDRVASELPLASSYEKKIKQAKAAIGNTINTSSPATHINSLPPEILTRIFYIVTDTCGLTYDVGNSIPLPRYPEFLSHVCTRWRQVALDSPRLWTHIDLVRLSAPNHGFKPRVETFVSRAGSCLLDVHLYEQADCYKYDHRSMLDIITMTAPQTKSLEFVARYIPGFGEYPPVLEHCFDKYVPGILTRLDLTKSIDPSDTGTRSTTHFIDGHGHANQTPTWPPLLRTPAERLDALLLPVTHLKLDGVYFPWAHRAYHGLVELRLLVNNEHTPLVPKLALRNILAASPRLRFLHFEVNVLDDLPGAPTPPIHLDDLEVLKLHSLDEETPHIVLSLLAGGPKPLRFSFAHGENIDMGDPQQEWLIQTKKFFKRSNITELRLQYAVWPPHVGPENLLESLPNLRVLALEGCADDPHYSSSPFPPPEPNLPRLDVIYMVECSIELGKLAQMLKHLRVELVVFWGCDFCKDDDMTQYHKDEEVIKAKLGAICSSFTWIDRNKPSPITHWD